MITEPMFVGTPTLRNYDDYQYGRAWSDGWNDAMEFIFGEELHSKRAEEIRANFRLEKNDEIQSRG